MPEPFRIAMIGAGGFAGAHLKAARRLREEQLADVEVAALTARSDRNFTRLRDRFGPIPCSTDLEAVLQDARIDAAIACVPHDQHLPVGLAVLASGKHLLMEKPLALSLDEGRQLVAAAQRADRQLLVGQCERYRPDTDALKSLLAEGSLGDVHAVRLDAMQHAAGFIPTEHWYRDGKRAGGGITRSVGVHRLDLARYLFGEVDWVQAVSRVIDPRFRAGAEDLMLGTLAFACGILGDFHFSWATARAPYSENLMIFGSRGTVHGIPAEPAQFGALQYSVVKDTEGAGDFSDQFGGFQTLPPVATQPTDDPVTNQLFHFVTCCQQGEAGRSSAVDNLGTLALVDAIEQSAAADGARVYLTE